MPVLRFDRWLLTVVTGLAALFTVLDPPASAGQALPATFAFWFLHIGAGMLLAVAATAALSEAPPSVTRRPFLRIALGGLIGSLLFAPLALAVEQVWPVDEAMRDSDDLLDQWEAAGGILALISEWLSLFPPYMASWLLVNAVPLATPTTTVAVESSAEHAPAPAALGEAMQPEQRNPGDSPGDSPAESGELADSMDMPVEILPDAAATLADDFMALLPPAIGADLIAIQADLHYLHVRTDRGRAMILASLSMAEQSLGTRGLRVHRSHWVALAHVRRLARSANGAALVLSDGSKVPISRRRVSEVIARLGHSFVIETG